MMEPEEKSKGEAEDKRNREKPAGLRNTHERHGYQTNHDDQPNGMASVLPASVGSKRHNGNLRRPAIARPSPAQ
jgi:hypothetical protein